MSSSIERFPGMGHAVLWIGVSSMLLALAACDDGGGAEPAPGVTCDSVCEERGQRRCTDGAVETCGDHDGDGCPEWGAAESCGELSCEAGQCVQTCEGDDCEEEDLPPEAVFSVVVSGERRVTVNAAGSTDDVTDPSELRFRWDWENDGVWDTELSTERARTHTYDGDEMHFTIALEVRDELGQSAVATRTVSLTPAEVIEGNIPTTTWDEDVVLSADAVVGTDDVLTIAAGTTIAFRYVDEDGDGIGDLGLTIHGELIVEGTADAPVTFTALGDVEPPRPGSWDRVLLAEGSRAHVLDHMVMEFGDTALEVASSARIRDLRVHNSRLGLQVSESAGGVELERARMDRNAGHGAVIAGGTVESIELAGTRNVRSGLVVSGGDDHGLVRCTMADNGRHGLELRGAGARVDRCRIYANGAVGVSLEGPAGGEVSDTLLVENGQEGVRALGSPGGAPDTVVRGNNIIGNGVAGNLARAVVDRAVTTEPAEVGTAETSPWTTPEDGALTAVEVSFDRSGSEGDLVARLRDGDGGVLAELSTPLDRVWIPVETDAAILVAELEDGSDSAAGTLTLHRVAYVGPARDRQIAAYLGEGTLDARRNWLGRWPNALAAVSYADPDDLDFQGFVGTPFEGGEVTGTFVGGFTLTEDTTWDTPDVFLTGDVRLAPGVTLTVEAGVTVAVVPVDQDGDGVGDFVLDRAAGQLVVKGTADAPVNFLARSSGEPTSIRDGWKGIRGSGDGSTVLRRVFVSNARTGIGATGGVVDLANVTVQFHGGAGLDVGGDAGLDARDLLFRHTGDSGARLTTGGPISLLRTACEAVQGWCLDFQGADHADNRVRGSKIIAGEAGGLRLQDAVGEFLHNDVRSNGFGVWIEGDSDVLVSGNRIQSNRREGVVVTRAGGAEPQATVTGNDIRQNGDEARLHVRPVDLVASSGSADTGTVREGPWTPVSGGAVCMVRAAYEESGDESGASAVSGALVGPGERVLRIWNDPATAAWTSVGPGCASAAEAVIRDESKSAGGTLTIHDALVSEPLPAGSTPIQMTVHLSDGMVDATGNYWGAGGPTGKVQAFEAGTVDLSEPAEEQLPDIGPPTP